MEKIIKNIIKRIKTSESTISTILGFFVVVATIVVGINYFRQKDGEGKIFPNEPGEEATTNEEKSGENNVYIVAKGDNLWKIAEKQYGSGYKWIEIAKTNKLANPGAIETGQKLTMPEVVVAAKPTPIVASQSPITENTYKVAKGDNLWKIAVRAYGDGYKWVEIARANKLTNPNLIHPGNFLAIPR